MSEKDKNKSEEIGSAREGTQPDERKSRDYFHIDDTPENVAKALFEVNPNEEGFEWEYMKDVKGRQQSQGSRT